MNKLLVICGPTASGKTSLAIGCAKKLGTDVVSADSQLVYKGLNVGTAKPTKEEMAGVKHHMIDVVEPTASFSVGDYRDAAIPILDELLNGGKTPVVCGGTGFYINSLLYDLSYGSVAKHEEIRKKYEDIAEEKGREYIYERLREVDLPTADKLHPNDVKRIIRALEIFEAGGKRKSELADGFKKRYEFCAFAIDYPREELYDRIERRVDEMFEKGLIDEVKNLLERGVGENCQCMQAIGYKEVVFWLKYGGLQSTMRGIIKQNTRHYAKRQITFFKKMPNLIWLKPEEATADRVLELINEKQ